MTISIYRYIRNGCVSLAALLLLSCGHHETTLSISAIDAVTGERVPAWASIQDSTGQTIKRPDDVPFLFTVPGDVFLFEDHLKLTVVPGTYIVRVGRGLNYYDTIDTIRVKRGRNKVALRLTKVVDMHKAGWYSAPAHLHMQVSKSDPKYPHNTIEDMMTWWPEAADFDVLINSAEGVGDAGLPIRGWYNDYFDAGRWFPKRAKYATLYDMGEEFRANPEGHALLWNVKAYIEPGSAGDESYLPGKYNFPTLADVGQAVTAQNGYFAWAHSGGGHSLEISVALGYCKGINFGDLEFGYDRWYRLLNAGYRITALGGPDYDFINGPRFYTRITGAFTWDNFMRALEQGRTFATSGPLLFFKVNGRDPGSEIQLAPGEKLTIEMEAFSKEPFGSLELVVNGQVAASFPTSGDHKHISVKTTYQPDSSSWIALRSTEFPGEDFRRKPGFGLPIESNNMRRAHTTPVYCIVDQKPIHSAQAIDDMVNWIEDFPKNWVNTKARFANKSDQEHALDQIEQALEALKARRETLNSNR